jgi:hypothetical protein
MDETNVIIASGAPNAPQKASENRKDTIHRKAAGIAGVAIFVGGFMAVIELIAVITILCGLTSLQSVNDIVVSSVIACVFIVLGVIFLKNGSKKTAVALIVLFGFYAVGMLVSEVVSYSVYDGIDSGVIFWVIISIFQIVDLVKYIKFRKPPKEIAELVAEEIKEPAAN